MADGHSTPDGGFYAAVPLEAEDCAAFVDIAGRMIKLSFRAPVVTSVATLTRREARGLALTLIDASQQIEEE
jgi:aminoglycoside/choline kinase family phosphotransferase